MQKSKKLFSLVLTLSLILGLSAPALAADESAPAAGDIVVLYTNDVHCGVTSGLGYAALAGYKAQVEAQYGADRVTLVDVGDHVQGDVIGMLSDGRWMTDLMNQVGYDLAVPGNHEFDYGMKAFLELAERAEFPYICCNFMDLTANKTVFAPYQILTYGETKVAFVGIDTPEAIIKSTPTYFQDGNGKYIYDFCGGRNGQELYEQVQKAVDAARVEGARYVVAMGHLGVDSDSSPWMSTEVIANTTGIDVFLDGHSHSSVPSQEVKAKDGKTVLLSQTGTKLAAIGQLTIGADGKLSTKLVTEYTGGESDAFKAAADKIAAIEGEYQELISRTVATSQVKLSTNDDSGQRIVRSQETNLGDLCADAYRTVLGADVAWANGGGIRAEIVPGPITYGDIIKVHPYSNMMCLVEVTGQQILDALELAYKNVGSGESGGFLHTSGLTVTIDSTIPSGVVTDEKGMFVKVEGPRRVSNVQVLGKDGKYAPIDPAGKYSLACHDYMLYDQGDGFSMFGKANVTVLKDRAMVDSDVLIRYITEDLNGVVTTEQYGQPQGRMTIVTAPAETPAETPTETPTETPAETPAEAPTETPTETPAETPTETSAETAPAAGSVYVVVPGDCLWRIAQRQYGSGALWIKIFELNRDTVKDANVLQPGQQLLIPAK